MQKVREAERRRQFEEFKDRKGDIVNGLVKRVEFGNVTVDLGRGEGILRRDELLPRETFRAGDRVRALIYDVREEQRGPQIFLSRTRNEFMGKLFAQEVPEIYDGIIEIRAVARDPGSRAKIAVISNDSSIDPVGACVGMRGSRVQAVVGELQGEKIDIIPWSADPATFVVNALAPAEVAKVVLDEDAHRIDVVVPDDQLSLAIGRRGQNVRLASQLTGWDIDILTEAQESERRSEEFRTRSQLFIEALDVDDVIAHLLVTEGFTKVEDVALVPLEDLAGIEGFDEEVANELRERARAFLQAQDERLNVKRRELGVSDEVAAIEGLTPAMLVTLGEAGVKTLDDLADLSGDELVNRGDGILRNFTPGRGRGQCHDHGGARPLVRGRRGSRASRSRPERRPGMGGARAWDDQGEARSDGVQGRQGSDPSDDQPGRRLDESPGRGGWRCGGQGARCAAAWSPGRSGPRPSCCASSSGRTTAC